MSRPGLHVIHPMIPFRQDVGYQEWKIFHSFYCCVMPTAYRIFKILSRFDRTMSNNVAVAAPALARRSVFRAPNFSISIVPAPSNTEYLT